MIYGIGVDLVNVTRMDRVLNRWGDRFKHRVFTPHETAFCMSRSRPTAAFSLRFAAKEAFSKALGTGMRKGVLWRDIEVFHYTGGKPGLNLYGQARELCRQVKISGVHLSLSDERNYAVAMVVLEKFDEAC